MTLTDFLLARIAEDEEAGRDPYIWQFSAARWEAECEAKRRIVEDFETLHRDYQVTHDPSTESRRFQSRIAMARLAAVYSDHPDFNPEWRP